MLPDRTTITRRHRRSAYFDGDYDEIEIRQEWQEENTLHEWDEGEFQLEPPLDTEEGRAAADEWDER
ncbi:hypothetical protein CRJUMX01_790021 [Escherichia coli]|nr:hypothetical protein CRJUMX01_790021 [Escherichia coli]